MIRLMRIVLLVFCLICSAFANAAEHRIQLWTMSMKPRFTPFFERLVRDYESRHPDVKVDWVDFPWDIIQLKLMTAIAAGKPPSLINLNVPWAAEYARAGLLLPVDALFDDATRFVPGALEDVRWRGKTYGFPFYSNVNVIAYNTRLFAQAGLTRPPQTLEEELRFASQIAQRTGKAGYAATLGKVDGFFLQQGLPLIEHGQAAFASPRHVALIRMLAEAYRSGGILKDKLFSEDSFPAVLDAYQGGRLAMMISAPTALQRVKIDAPTIYAETAVAPTPIGPSGLSDGGWLFHFAIPAGVASSELPAIAAFANDLTSAANQLKFAQQAGVMPTDRHALADPWFQRQANARGAADAAMTVAAQAMPRVRSLYVGDIDDYDEMRRVLVQAAEAGITGKQDIAAALAQAAQFWNRKLAHLRTTEEKHAK